MEVLTPQRLAEIKSKNGRPTKNERVYGMLFSLKVGDTLHVRVSDWKIKTPPYWNVNPVARQRGSSHRFACKKLKNGKGWIITRTV